MDFTEIVKYRMGIWYTKKFIADEKPWDESCIQMHLKRGKLWMERWQREGISNNPGVLLNGKDAFLYKSEKVEPELPIVAHARHAEENSSIMCPINQIRDQDIQNINKKDKIDFKDKINEIIWRGKLTGVNNEGVPAQENADFFEECRQYERYNVVLKWHKKFNIKFTHNLLIGRDPNVIFPAPYRERIERNFAMIRERLLPDMLADFMPFQSQVLLYKYILNLDGNDWGSGLIDSLRSNSVVLSPVPKWHNIINFKLKPWEHYVPLVENAKDLEEKLEWCKHNDKECNLIAQRATNHCEQFSLKQEQEIEKNVFSILQQNST